MRFLFDWGGEPAIRCVREKMLQGERESFRSIGIGERPQELQRVPVGWQYRIRRREHCDDEYTQSFGSRCIADE